MAVFIIILCAIVALVILYAIWGRKWLKAQSWSKPFFDAVEPLELALFKKSETILMGRLLWVGGLFVSLYDGIAIFVQGADMTPLTTRALDAAHVPQDMRGLTVAAFIALIGRIFTWLRAQTTKPLELVAVQETTAPPEVKAAIAKADIVKEQAVATVQAAQ